MYELVFAIVNASLDKQQTKKSTNKNAQGYSTTA